MNGLELSRGYYETYGKPMLEQSFPDLLPFLAIGLVGSGSDCYGFDDEISRDHDLEPGFCIFLPEEEIVDRKQAFQLERAYAKLPKTYEGFTRQSISPVGGSRNGVMRIADFYMAMTGTPDGKLTDAQWLSMPDEMLFEAVNGEVFEDYYGHFSDIRQKLQQLPEPIRLKRLAGNLLVMAQAGQYNFTRCLQHHEPDSAQLACVRFVKACMKVEFLLHRQYMPYYKWSFRALRRLEQAKTVADLLPELLYGDNRDAAVARKKYDTIENISSYVISRLQEQGLTNAICGDLEKHAYSVNDFIQDGELRNLHILAGIRD